MGFHTPTIQEIEAAREAFETNEPRDLFYRAATELVDLAMQGMTSLSVTEALAVLLQTWNKAFYRYNPFDSQHFSDIECVVSYHKQALSVFRQRSIEDFNSKDEPIVEKMFKDFEEVLGPVGAAKCLHLMAPRFFPLWDRAIAEAYGLALKRRGENAERYCRFIEITQEQVKNLGGEQTMGRNPLKALDEYNYCKHTKQWI
ncbi:MAG TPA: hypothetical protein EYP85_05280 [Armatimonadetes bacterium]|nr:hypothetical protein [Armatimonadota bacterium]